MNKILIHLTILSFLGLLSFAQPCADRYFDNVFPSVTKHTDIIYGNAPELTTIYVAENVTVDIDLKMDLFEPTGDTISKRPLLIFTFAGAFIFGSKEDGDVQGICDTFARKGYVTAAINYRKGINVLSTISGERAVYRAVQDFNAAIRYLKEFHQIYRIDTNKIFIGGASAGAFAALHHAYMEEADRPLSTFEGGLFDARPDLGCSSCSGNNYVHTSNVTAVINCWGAIGDPNWIDSTDNVPLISFHGDQDGIVPFASGYPFSIATLPLVYGSQVIHNRLDFLGTYNEFYPYYGEGHSIWGSVSNNQFSPTIYWQPILNNIRDFLYSYTKLPEGACIECGIPVCNAPDSLYTDHLTCNAATLKWQINPCTDQYELRGRKVGSATWQLITLNASKDSLRVSSLSCGTNYEWQMRSICGSENSLWSSLDTFSTSPLGVPTMLNASMITSTSAKLSWNRVACANSYELRGNKTGAAGLIKLKLNGNNNTSRFVNDLNCATDYFWQIRPIAKCSSTAVSSTDTFSTLICPPKLLLSDPSDVSDEILLYPNPVQSSLTIYLEFETSASMKIQISDLTGRIVKELNVENRTSEIEIDVKGFAKGTYFVKLLLSESTSPTLKFIKI